MMLPGVLLPIATSLNYKMAPEKVLVTGAVSTSAPGAAELDMSVKMTQQSAQEALTLVKNYLQHLQPKISIPRLFGEFLDHYTIHHQLLTASYNVGGPSAGYALALNTLSALLMIPVFNDFGVTGAPWTRGAKKGEIGGSVIIGGHKKKTEKVLLHLRRMYMPLQNYKDLEIDYLENYWLQDKDILGVTNFGDLVPEVLWLEGAHGDRVQQLIDTRIRYKLAKCQRKRPDADLKEQILALKVELRDDMEKEIVRRLQALRAYMRSPVRDPHISLEEIFRNGAGQPHRRITAVVQLVRNGLNRFPQGVSHRLTPPGSKRLPPEVLSSFFPPIVCLLLFIPLCLRYRNRNIDAPCLGGPAGMTVPEEQVSSNSCEMDFGVQICGPFSTRLNGLRFDDGLTDNNADMLRTSERVVR